MIIFKPWFRKSLKSFLPKFNFSVIEDDNFYHESTDTTIVYEENNNLEEQDDQLSQFEKRKMKKVPDMFFNPEFEQKSDSFLKDLQTRFSNLPVETYKVTVKQLISYSSNSYRKYIDNFLKNEEIVLSIKKIFDFAIENQVEDLYVDLYVLISIFESKSLNAHLLLSLIKENLDKLRIEIIDGIKKECYDIRTLIRILSSNLTNEWSDISSLVLQEVIKNLHSKSTEDLEIHYLFKILQTLKNPTIRSWDLTNSMIRLLHENKLFSKSYSITNCSRILFLMSELNFPMESYKDDLIDGCIDYLLSVFPNTDTSFRDFGWLLHASLRLPNNKKMDKLMNVVFECFEKELDQENEFKAYGFVIEIFEYVWLIHQKMIIFQEQERRVKMIIRYFSKPFHTLSVHKLASFAKIMGQRFVLENDHSLIRHFYPFLLNFMKNVVEFNKFNTLAWYLPKADLIELIKKVDWIKLSDEDKSFFWFLCTYRDLGYKFELSKDKLFKYASNDWGFMHFIRLDEKIFKFLLDENIDVGKLHLVAQMNLYCFLEKKGINRSLKEVLLILIKKDFFRPSNIKETNFIFYESSIQLCFRIYFEASSKERALIFDQTSRIISENLIFKWNYDIFETRICGLMIMRFSKYKDFSFFILPKEDKLIIERSLFTYTINKIYIGKNTDLFSLYLNYCLDTKTKIEILFAVEIAKKLLKLSTEHVDLTKLNQLNDESFLHLFFLLYTRENTLTLNKLKSRSTKYFLKSIEKIHEEKTKDQKIDLLMLLKSCPVEKLKTLINYSKSKNVYISSQVEFLCSLLLIKMQNPSINTIEPFLDLLDLNQLQNSDQALRFCQFLYDNFQEKFPTPGLMKIIEYIGPKILTFRMFKIGINYSTMSFVFTKLFLGEIDIISKSLFLESPTYRNFLVNYAFGLGVKVNEILKLCEDFYIEKIPVIILTKLIILYFYEFGQEKSQAKIEQLFKIKICFDEIVNYRTFVLANDLIKEKFSKMEKEMAKIKTGAHFSKTLHGTPFFEIEMSLFRMGFKLKDIKKLTTAKIAQLGNDGMYIVEDVGANIEKVDPELYAALACMKLNNPVIIRTQSLKQMNNKEKMDHLTKLGVCHKKK